jgi:hypothetical protein
VPFSSRGYRQWPLSAARTIQDTAAEQNMNSRTVRRRLGAAGTTDRALLEEARKSAA